MVSYIWIIHISPETDFSGKFFPHSFVLPYRLFTFADKGIQTISFNLLFSVNSQLLLNLKLNRKTMGIPSCLTDNLMTLHCLISWNHILNNTGKYMSDMWLTVCCWRSVIECINRTSLFFFNGFFENFILFPKIQCLLLTLYEI